MARAECKAILCNKPANTDGWCRRHKGCAVHEKFGLLLQPKIEAMGGRRVPSHNDESGRGWSYELETRAGKLTVHFWRDSYALFSRFEDEKRAVALLGSSFGIGAVNPYSGKWNHHIDDGHPPDTAAMYVENQLRSVL